MAAYYNEIDPYCAEWLRNLIAEGLIAPGEVDERDARDVEPGELDEFTQCHFFAGVGVWSYALRLAGWPDDRPVWTGSCPCQPFSSAGRRGGVADERHLWPHWHHLIRVRRPRVVFGEQVASKDGLAWLDLVQSDLEGEDYACGAFDLSAAGFGAPHIRQRLYFAAYDLRFAGGMENAECAPRTRQRQHGGEGVREQEAARPTRGGVAYGLESNRGDAGLFQEHGAVGGVEHACGERRERREETAPGHQHDGKASERPEGQHGAGESVPSGVHASGGMADNAGERRHRSEGAAGQTGRTCTEDSGAAHRPGPTDGFWRDADWLGCRDDKFRPVEPGTFPLVDGTPARVGRLRAYGNAIVAPQAQAFVEAYLETERA